MMRRIVANHSGVMTGGNRVRAMLPSPAKQGAKLEVAVTRNTWIRCPPAQIILSERLHDRFGKLRAQVEQCVRNSQMFGNFLGAAVIRAYPWPLLSFPHA